MTELLVLLIFALVLFLCISFDISILAALVFGFFLFFGYGLYRKHTVIEMLAMAGTGIKTVKGILLTFLFIGMITAMWRVSGTIPYIVYHAMRFLSSQMMVLLTFLLCVLISVLTGTAFGTSATMGVICATIANSMGIPILYIGGAVLSGSYFGDRCSPMSTSALLVSSLTKTDLFRNISNMIKTSLFPLALSCVIYFTVGAGMEGSSDVFAIQQLFSDHFVLRPVAVIPAGVIIILSLFRVNVKITMIVSILCSAVIAMFVQNVPVGELFRIAVLGYCPEDPQVAALLSGGGVVSMVRVICIVCLSSCYSGMFNGTGLLDGIREMIAVMGQKLTPYGGILVTSILTAMISCNQTLTIMLTHQLCVDVEKDGEKMASCLEDTAVVVPPLIPWSIAATVSLTAVGAPSDSILMACYLYLLPMCRFVAAVFQRKIKGKSE